MRRTFLGSTWDGDGDAEMHPLKIFYVAAHQVEFEFTWHPFQKYFYVAAQVEGGQRAIKSLANTFLCQTPPLLLLLILVVLLISL